MQKFFDNVGTLDEAGDMVPINDAIVTVYDVGTSDLSTIYSDDGLTLKDNPFKTTDMGFFSFYAADGRYDIVVSYDSFQTVTLSDILIEDPTEPEDMTMSYHLSVFDHSNISANTSSVLSLATADSTNLSFAYSATESSVTRLSTVDSSLTASISENLSVNTSADISIISRLSAVDSSFTNTDSVNLSSSVSADTSVVERLSAVDSSLVVSDSTNLSVAMSADTSLISALESEISAVLPDQSGHGGDILYSDGSDAYWDDPSAGSEDFYVKRNKQTFDINYTLTGDYNGSCVGPITIADTKTLTIQDDAILVVL